MLAKKHARGGARFGAPNDKKCGRERRWRRGRTGAGRTASGSKRDWSSDGTDEAGYVDCDAGEVCEETSQFGLTRKIEERDEHAAKALRLKPPLYR